VKGRAVIVLEHILYTASAIRVEDGRHLALHGNFFFNCSDCLNNNCFRAIKAQYARVTLNGNFSFENFCVTGNKVEQQEVHDRLRSVDGGTLLVQVLEVTPHSSISILRSRNPVGKGGAIAGQLIEADGFMEFVNTSAKLDGGAIAIVPVAKHKQRYVAHSWHLECQKPAASKITDLDLDPRGEKLAILGRGCKQMFFSTTTGLADWRGHAEAWHKTHARKVRWSPAGDRVAVGYLHDNRYGIYIFNPADVDTGRIYYGNGLGTGVELGTKPLTDMHFDSEGKFLAFGADKECHLRDEEPCEGREQVQDAEEHGRASYIIGVGVSTYIDFRC